MSESFMSPEYPTVITGIRKQVVTKILPLSWHDAKNLQAYFSKLIEGVVSMVMMKKQDSEVYKYIFCYLTDNIDTVLNLVSEEQLDTRELTLEQVIEIAGIVYEQNFANIQKNVESLLQNLNMMQEKALETMEKKEVE